MRKNGFPKKIRSRRGVVIILAALLFTIILVVTGVAVDLGSAYVNISKLQAAADAAAYAGATLLPVSVSDTTKQAQIRTLVDEYVLKNGDNDFQVVGVDYGDSFANTLDNGTTEQIYSSVRVRLRRNVKFFFGPIVGLQGTTVNRFAKVRIEAVVGGPRIVPLGISLEKRTRAQTTAIIFDKNDYEQINGFYGSLDLDGNPNSGGSVFKDQFINGYPGELTLNDPNHLIISENGIMAGPVSQAFNARYDACTHFVSQGGCNSTHFDPNCPRVIIIVIYQRYIDPDHPNRISFMPLGYAPYILDSFDTSTKSLYADPIDLRIKIGKSAQLTDMNYDFGLFRVRLVE